MAWALLVVWFWILNLWCIELCISDANVLRILYITLYLQRNLSWNSENFNNHGINLAFARSSRNSNKSNLNTKTDNISPSFRMTKLCWRFKYLKKIRFGFNFKKLDLDIFRQFQTFITYSLISIERQKKAEYNNTIFDIVLGTIESILFMFFNHYFPSYLIVFSI